MLAATKQKAFTATFTRRWDVQRRKVVWAGLRFITSFKNKGVILKKKKKWFIVQFLYRGVVAIGTPHILWRVSGAQLSKK